MPLSPTPHSNTTGNNKPSLTTTKPSLSLSSSSSNSSTPKDLRSPTSPRRPSFSSRNTSDRLSESDRVPSFRLCTIKTEKKERRSVFKELGLEDEEINHLGEKEKRLPKTPLATPGHGRSQSDSIGDSGDGRRRDTQQDTQQQKLKKERAEKEKYTPGLELLEERKPWYSKLTSSRRPTIRSASSAPTGLATLPRVAMIAFLLAIVIPGLLTKGPNGVPADGANAGVIKARDVEAGAGGVWKREDSKTDTCTRWSHQAALLNGTLYIYGGQSTEKAGQEENTWNSNFLTLDLSKSWEKTSPALKGLPKPDGPPAVANGYLWNSYTSLYLYGGLYSETPPQTPDPVSIWEYNIPEAKWMEHADPKTTDGNFSEPSGQSLQRSAEGAGLSVPELGLSWYFGGHQDMYTTKGWSNQVPRIYLTSLLEFTHPGYMNTGVRGLGVGESGAPSDNLAFRNITEGGIQSSSGFTERADGVLVYVPGWGLSGIVLGLAGGISVPDGDEGSFTDLSTIDIYDVASSRWYKQSTSGTPPGIRVNPCAVVFAAPDASSFNVYLYGGQNLYPYGEQRQYDDVWILTIPSFSWVKVETEGQAKPPARAGHTCHAWDGQMVVVGGYVGKDLSCDSPGIYVFNASSLEWSNNFNAVAGSVAPAPVNPNGVGSGSGRKSSSGGGDSADSNTEERAEGEGFIYAGLQGSNGYTVPEAVIKMVGGGPSGSATITAPAAGTPSDGPIATGKAPVFTITAPGTTVTSQPTSTVLPDGSIAQADSGNGEPNVPAIVAGVVAGVLGLLAAYLAFCTWLYRRQLKLYKDHVAMAQRAAFTSGGEKTAPGSAAGPTSTSGGGAPIVGAFGTVVGRTSESQAEGRNSLASSAGGGLGGGVTRPDLVAKGGRTETGQTGMGGTTDEGYLAGASGESEGPDSGRSSFDSLGGMEPNFFSVVMSPRRTLRVINRD